MATDHSAREHIDELLRFRSTLGSPGPDTVLETDPDSRYPSYTPEVKEFFRLASKWCVGDYSPQKHGAMLYDDDAVRAAGLEDIRRMLTFCVRGERFSDGHWLTMIRDGRIGALLRRLEELRAGGETSWSAQEAG